MKTPLLALFACLLAIPSTRADESAADAATPPPEPPAMTYDTAERIRTMPRCKGKVLELFPCCARMITADGEKFWIGSPGATSEVVRFVQTLKEGQECEFPSAFQDWRKKSGPKAAVFTVLVQFLPPSERMVAGVAQCGAAQDGSRAR